MELDRINHKIKPLNFVTKYSITEESEICPFARKNEDKQKPVEGFTFLQLKEANKREDGVFNYTDFIRRTLHISHNLDPLKCCELFLENLAK